MALPANARPCCFVLTSDRTRALPFYRDVLGLAVLAEDPFAVTFDLGGGATLRLTSMPGHVAAATTVLGWTVTDLLAVLDALAAAGVAPVMFDGMGQDERGVWAHAGARLVWFKDPDENVLSLTEFDQA